MPTQDQCNTCRENIYGAIGKLRDCVKSKVGKWVLTTIIGITITVISGLAVMMLLVASNAQENAVKIAEGKTRTDDLKEDVEEIKQAQRTADRKLDKILDRLPRRESD